MKLMKWMFVLMGVVFIVTGTIAIVWAIGDDSSARWGVGVGVGSLAIAGVVFLFVARYLGRLDTRDVLADGEPGTAQVLDVRDSGVTINNVNAVFKVRATITVASRPPYETEFRVALSRPQWGTIQPGMVLPVRVDPDKPERVAIDSSRQTIAARPGMTGPTSPSIDGLQGHANVVQHSAADVIARGVATSGQIHSVTATGVNAGQFAPHLPPHEADDPLMAVAFVYDGPGGTSMASQAVMRIPDGKASRLTPNATVPVRYLADQPTVATIDWDRL